MDSIDKQILALLRRDSKQNFKSIGEQIHMTGQAVGQRIKKLEDDSIIESYTVKLNAQKLGTITAYMTLILKDRDHASLKRFVMDKDEIIEAVRISGEGCYIIKVEVESLEDINRLCDEVTRIARYRLNIITERLK